MKYQETAKWVIKVIESCQTPQQAANAHKLIELYKKRFISTEKSLLNSVLIGYVIAMLSTSILKLRQLHERNIN